MKVPIDPQREYSPSEIAKYGFILNTKGKPDYRYVLRLIGAKKLRAKNVIRSTDAKYFKVLGSDIIKWKNATFTMPEQPTTIERKKREHRPYPQATLPQ